MEYTKGSESPDNYHMWMALSCLASAVRRNVFLNQQLYVLYPNLFIAFVGPPARTAKSTAIYLGDRLLWQVPGIRFGPSAGSKEELIQRMAESKLNNQCAVVIHSSEFSSLIDTSGAAMIKFLLDIYDGNYTPPGGWEYATKNKGKANIINPCLNLLVGTTPSYLAEALPSNIVGHGFTSRLITIYEERERLINPRPTAMDAPITQALIDDLRHISQIFGEFAWTDEGRATYDSFYTGLYKDPPEDYRMQGYHWRKKTHVLKLAMLLALAESDNLVLDRREIDAAVQILHGIEEDMVRSFSAVGKYDHATDVERIGSLIRQRGSISREEFTRKFYWAGDPMQIDQIIQTLIRMGAMYVDRSSGSEVYIAKDVELPWE